MFEELRYELSVIRTPKFHLVDGPASGALHAAIAANDPGMPRSYVAFVLEFGNAKLYRWPSYYEIEIYAGHRGAIGQNNEDPICFDLICFGRTPDSFAYFKSELLAGGEETPVFEWDPETGLSEAAGGFSDWLAALSAAARRRYSPKEWDAIEAGPEPFDARELAIVEARRRFSWRVVAVSIAGDTIFEVTNGSQLRLPFLSIGIRGALRPPTSGPLHGVVYIPVSSLAPGETRTLNRIATRRSSTRKMLNPSTCLIQNPRIEHDTRNSCRFPIPGAAQEYVCAGKMSQALDQG